MNAKRMILGVVSAFLATFIGVALSWADDRPTRTLDASETAGLFGGQQSPNNQCPQTDPNCTPAIYNTYKCDSGKYTNSQTCYNSVFQYSSGPNQNCFASKITPTYCGPTPGVTPQFAPCLYSQGCTWNPGATPPACGPINGPATGKWNALTLPVASTNCGGQGGGTH
jgi:hypothetical protein